MKEKQHMFLSELFLARGIEKADQLAKERAKIDAGVKSQIRATGKERRGYAALRWQGKDWSPSWPTDVSYEGKATKNKNTTRQLRTVRLATASRKLAPSSLSYREGRWCQEGFKRLTNDSIVLLLFVPTRDKRVLSMI